MMKHKQSRKPMEKISKLPKNQVVRRKKDNQALNFKQTMATNLGNTRNAVENKPPCLTAAILAFFIRPRFPLRATRTPRTRQALISRACMALHALQRPPCSCLRSPEKGEK